MTLKIYTRLKIKVSIKIVKENNYRKPYPQNFKKLFIKQHTNVFLVERKIYLGRISYVNID